MDALAERLGIGSRHLRRLFFQHLGASPITVAQTRRLHFAKKLIDESHLPMGEIALASGFGSIRRFNAAFRKTYDRTPTHLRKLARKSAALSENEYQFQLRFRPPFCWHGLLEFLAPRATPGSSWLSPDAIGVRFQCRAILAGLKPPSAPVAMTSRFEFIFPSRGRYS